MASPLTNEHCCIKHCWGVYEPNRIVNSVGADDLTSEREIIASNGNKAEGLHAHDVSMFIPYFVNKKLYKAIKKAE